MCQLVAPMGMLVSSIDCALVGEINVVSISVEVGVAFKSANDSLVSGIDSV